MYSNDIIDMFHGHILSRHHYLQGHQMQLIVLELVAN